MMKMTKKNWLIVAIYTAIISIGNVSTNYAIAKNTKNGWTEYQIAKSNLIWRTISLIGGIIVNMTILEK